MISWLFVFFIIRSLFVGNHDHKNNKQKKKTKKKQTNCETGWGRDQFVRIYLVKKGFIEVIWSYCKFL